MPAPQEDALRPFTPNERIHLEHVSRSRTDPAAQVGRAEELLAVADGASFEGAARLAGRKSGTVLVVDPDAAAKKTCRSLPRWVARTSIWRSRSSGSWCAEHWTASIRRHQTRSSTGWRQQPGPGTESRHPSSGVGSGRPDASGHASDATPLAGQVPAPGGHSHDDERRDAVPSTRW